MKAFPCKIIVVGYLESNFVFGRLLNIEYQRDLDKKFTCVFEEPSYDRESFIKVPKMFWNVPLPYLREIESLH